MTSSAPGRAFPPHVVLVCWGFPPFRGSGAFRPLAVANGLVAQGADVTVVTATREPFQFRYGSDPALERAVDERVTVVRVPFFPERSWPQLNDWPRMRAFRPKAYSAAMRLRNPFPEKIYPPWLPRARDAVLEVHREHPVTLVLGTGVPYVDLEVAAQAAADIGAPLVLDDRDSFLMDVFTGEVDQRYEQRLPYWLRWSQQARELWFVNPPIAAWHAERFAGAAERIVVVENGWDAAAVQPERAAPALTRAADRPLQLGYVGLVPTNFPMRPLLDAWASILPELPAGSAMQFVGPLGYEVGSAAWQRTAAAVEQAPAVSWRGHLSKPELAQVYQELDVLLLVKEGGPMVTGGKTYEYAATGLPIAAVVDPASDALRVLARHPRLHVAPSPAVPDVAAALRSALADARADDGTRQRAAAEFGAGMERGRQLRPHLHRLLELA